LDSIDLKIFNSLKCVIDQLILGGLLMQ